MKRHASMNRVFRLVWNQASGIWVCASETTRGRGKSTSKVSQRKRSAAMLAAMSFGALAAPYAMAAPVGGVVTSGAATVTTAGSTTNINQSSANVSLNWQSFNIGSSETVNFVQPSTSSIAVNRIADTNGTQIYGSLNANGQVFLINPNGVLFGAGSQVNVGGLVATTLNVSDSDLASANRTFSGSGKGSVVNQGTITAADGGYVALIGNTVSNQGVIAAKLGTVALAGASAATLTFSGNSLVSVTVDQSTLDTLAENKQLIKADGGLVLMTAGAKDSLLASAVNNTGVVEAQTVDSHEGTITLLAGMKAGTTTVGGTLDASAPNGGNGGFVETSAANVKVADDAKITTLAANGQSGTWLIDPTDFTIAAGGGAQTASGIGATTLSTNLNGGSVSIVTAAAGADAGNINVNSAVSWTANTTLSLQAAGAINVNANITASGASSGLTLTHVAGLNIATGNAITLSGTSALTINGNAYTLITSLANLQALQGTTTGFYALAGDVDATSSSALNGGTGFSPIATVGTPFLGTLEGLGHTIQNLTISRAGVADQGLFGGLGVGSLVENINFTGASITGGSGTGILVGDNVGGTIRYASVAGTVNGGTSTGIGGIVGSNQATSTIINSTSSATVSGGTQVGGFVGLNQDSATITNSSATGNVTGSNSVGGFAGVVTSATASQTTYGITNSTASGNVTGDSEVGGFVGNASSGAYINLDTASGTVTGTNANAAQNIGGLVGYAVVGSTIANSSSSSAVTATGSENVGGVIGQNSSANATLLHHTGGTVTGLNNVGGVVGLNQGGALSKSYNTGNVVANNQFAGGVVGLNQAGGIGATVDQTFNFGNVTATGNFAGGVAGANANPTNVTPSSVTNSYSAQGTVSAGYGSGGVIGLADTTNPTTVTNVYSSSPVINGGGAAGGIYGQSSGTAATTTNAYYLSGTGVSTGNGNGSPVGTALTGTAETAAGSYAFDTSGTGAWKIYEGQTSPLLTFNLTPVTVTPGTTTTGTSVYDGTDKLAAARSAVVYTNTSTGAALDTAAATANNTLQGTAYGTTTSIVNAGSYLLSGPYSRQLSSTNPNVGGLNLSFSGSYTVTPAILTATLNPQTKVYDGNANATLSSGSYVLNGLVGSDSFTVSQTAGTYNSSQVLTATTVTSGALSSSNVTANGATLASNYTLPTVATGVGTITPLAITAATAAANKVYDGTTAATTTSTATGVLTGDQVTVAATGTFSDKNAGTAKTVTISGLTLGGAQGSNYTVTGNATTTANITPKTLAATATASNKVYDGTTVASVVVGGTGVVTGDTVSFSGTGVFSDKNVANGKTVTVSGIALGGTDAGNYTVASSVNTTANITPASLVYVATPATFTAGTAPSGLAGTVTGFVNGETLASATTGTAAWTTPATTASAAGTYAINGSGLAAQNYTFTQAAANATALTLTPAGVVVPPPTTGTTTGPTTAQLATIAAQVAAIQTRYLPTSVYESGLREPGTDDVYSGIARVSPSKFNPTDFVTVRPDVRKNTLAQVAADGGMRLPADRLIPPGGEAATPRASDSSSK